MDLGLSIAGGVVFLPIMLAMLAVGRRLTRALGISTETLAGEFALAFAGGWAVFTLAVQILGWTHLIHPLPIAILVVSALIIGWKELSLWFVKLGKTVTSKQTLGLIEMTVALIICVYMALFLISSLAPMVNEDAEACHYQNPKCYLEQHSIHDIQGNLYNGYPWAHSCLILINLALGGESAANLVNWMFTLATILLFLEIGARYRSREAGFIMVVLLLGLDSIYKLISPGFMDMALVFLTAGAFLSIDEWLKRRETGTALKLGLFLGLLAATKYNGLLPVTYLIPIILFSAFNSRYVKGGFRQLGLIALPFLIISFPFEGLNLILRGNPVYPFLHTFFTGEILAGKDDITSWIQVGEPRTFGGFLKYILRLFSPVNGRIYPFSSVALVLFFPGLIFTLRNRRGAVPGIYAILHLIFAYMLMPGITRYLLPGIAAMILTIGFWVSTWKFSGLRKFASLLLILPFLIQLPASANIAIHTYPVVFGSKTSKEYLSEYSGFYDVLHALDDVRQPGDRTWLIDKRIYRAPGDTIQYLPKTPDLETDISCLHGLLIDADIDYIVLSLEYNEMLMALDIIFDCMESEPGPLITLTAEQINVKVDEHGIGNRAVIDIVNGLDNGNPGDYVYLLDREYIIRKWPNVELYAKMVSCFHEMKNAGYLETVFNSRGGWLYRVVLPKPKTELAIEALSVIPERVVES